MVPMKLSNNSVVPHEGKDFFTDIKKLADKCVHPDDLENVNKILNKDYMLQRLTGNDRNFIYYRLLLEGKIIHIQHSEFMCQDKEHILCCLKDVEDTYQEKEEQKKALESTERLARFDLLTGVRNKNAFKEYSESLEFKIQTDKDYTFGLVICDLNDLKLLNDSRGHNFGDEAIQRSSRMICDLFTHSPVFSIGGDEFVVILHGQDFDNRELLFKSLKQESLDNKLSRSGPVLACGMSVYDKKTDKVFSDVFARADKLMYKNKKEIKSMNLTQSFREMEKIDTPITPERKRLLDTLFGAMCTISDGGYVYLNDMRYDYSRWSLSLVDDFGMESEYMYHADKLWQEKIHPDDIVAYRKAVDAVLCDNVEMIHPLTYRARKKDGTYVVLTTRGFILSDGNGKSEYFGGVIIQLSN